MDIVSIVERDRVLDRWAEIDEWLDVKRAIGQLTAKQCEALALWVEGGTQREIGEVLGIAHQNVGKRLERAIERIRRLLAIGTVPNEGVSVV